MFGTRQPFDSKKLIEISIISLVIIEGLSFILNKISPDIPFIKGGFIIFLFLAVIVLVTLYNFGTNLTSLKIKDFLFMFLVLLISVALYIILPMAIPQIFSVNGIDPTPANSLKDFLVNSLGSIVNISGTGVI
jgi:uncharacterized membrane protein